MFTLNVRKLFRNTFGSWQTATPLRREALPAFRPGLEVLEERCCLSGGSPYATQSTALYWDPTSGNDASNTANWDVTSLGSHNHPLFAPGNTLNLKNENVIFFDGSAGKGGNVNCTWDYTPTFDLGGVYFQNGWNQTVSFLDKQGFSVFSGGSNVQVIGSSAPTITPNGSSGANAVPAITLTDGAYFDVDYGSTLFLQGYGGGNAIFIAGDGMGGEFLNNNGTVVYSGVGSQTTTANIDYLKIPVQNNGVFKVNGNIGTTKTGAVLQVSGADTTYTQGVSFYQSNSAAETDISGKGTLWCYNITPACKIFTYSYWQHTGRMDVGSNS